jgi:trk/ktr system potassium uptake protein
MNILIVGAGEVGYHLASVLSREEHRVTVVDSDPTKARRLMESLDVQAHVGDATRAEVLTTCGAPKADLCVAVSGEDRVNMLACVLARHLGSKRVVLRLKDTAQLSGYEYFYKRTLGFDVVISTEELAADEIVNAVREQNALEVESFAGGVVQLRRLRLRVESEVTSEPLSDLRLPAGVLVVAVMRGSDFFVPKGNTQLAADDQIYALGTSSDLDVLDRMTGAQPQGRRSVVLMGGGGLGREITRRLCDVPGISIRIIERDPVRARALAAEQTSDVMVLEGEATDLDLLLEERIGEAQVFIATSDDDEDNMVACQLVRSLGIERTVALVNKASYRQIYDLLGIDQAISPRILCANRILRFVRSSSPASIAVIGEGRAEVLELRARFSGKSSRKVKSLGLPHGAVIGAIVRGDDEVIVPHGETSVKDGDRVIVFTLPEELEDVERVFGRPPEAGD